MFPCTNCGLCCQNISSINELKDFDLGNGTCKYFDNISSSCKIYEARPNICRIDKMYEIKYNNFFTKNDFYIENSKVCNKLQEIYKLDNSFKVIIGD
jgi:Fe-S-cluster containining protein